MNKQSCHSVISTTPRFLQELQYSMGRRQVEIKHVNEGLTVSITHKGDKAQGNKEQY